MFGVCVSSTLSAARPNVVIVMTDDQGYPKVSAHGNPVLQTPNLDSLHRQSLRLTDYHVTPMCTPTREQLPTGIEYRTCRREPGNTGSTRTNVTSDIEIKSLQIFQLKSI